MGGGGCEDGEYQFYVRFSGPGFDGRGAVGFVDDAGPFPLPGDYAIMVAVWRGNEENEKDSGA